MKNDGVVGRMMKINIDTIQLIAGTTTPILEPGPVLGYLDKTWVSSLHLLLAELDMKILVYGKWTISTQRECDAILMDVFAKHFEPKAIILLNQCRLYLEALTLADIITTEGNEITTTAWKVALSIE